MLNESTHQPSKNSSVDSLQSIDDDVKQLIRADDDIAGRTSLGWASFNYLNSILGSGLIGMPYALHAAGFGCGMTLLVLVAAITDYSLVLMVRSAHLCGRFTYAGIMEAAFGRAGYILLSLLQLIYPVIAMVSYNVIVGDTVTKLLVRLTGCATNALLARREVVVFGATLLITLPLCLYRDIARLAKISFVSLLCLAFILFAVLLRLGPMRKLVNQVHQVDSWRMVNWDIVPAIGIMSFAFMCHHNTFLLYASIEDATQRRWDRVTHASLAIAAVVAALFGIAGYATFTAHVQGDLLENYCWDDDLMNVCRILFAVQILLTFPIECFVCRQVLQAMVTPHAAHHVLTFVIIAITYLISMATDCLSVVLELNGVLAAVPLAYLLPAGVYLRLETGGLMTRQKLPALMVFLFGFVVAGLGALFLLWNVNAVDTCTHGQAMVYCGGRMNVTL